MSSITATVADLVDREEIDLVVSADGKADLRFPVWVVVVDGVAYVRSYKGPTALWFRRVTRHADGAISLGGDDVPVRFEPEPDPRIAAAIDREYERKYRQYSYVDAMNADVVKATTLRLDARTP